MNINLFFQKITFIKEFPGSNILLPSFLTGGKWDFQVADLLPATVIINRRIISVNINLFFQKITFIKEFPGSNILLPSFLTGGKWDFQVADLLPATVNFEPRS